MDVEVVIWTWQKSFELFYCPGVIILIFNGANDVREVIVQNFGYL